ncbi:lid2 complex component snt2 [Lichtheimia corymbifera JMRC:FSU:9682]|uniref:Lid2 complex component snt2 n=1 Tax=Lichtheimia corymbifera JMRC:FSU:9682 TaxID=1263082 RepID=A0A068RMU7_9FUNG|nr:lid2 complex component snt2 [Lichtheimia corymbifera JMRC:FSU:9682]
MADSKAAITKAKLADGTTVSVNDHVYLTPEHLGESYYIGRIMEFCSSPKRRGLQARIAWFNRPKDVISRKSYDPRLLVATMHSDVNPITSIRGKCTVTYKNYIPSNQLDVYKRQDDHFYYHQLYDRYMQRVYDIIPSRLVQNIPINIQQALCERYEFVVVEQGKVADLTVARRTCCVCHSWCASVSSVKCAACQKNFHMSCINPPLLRKPPKGFAWQCTFCTRLEHQDEEASSTNSNTSSSVLEEKPKKSSSSENKRFTRTTRSQSQQKSNPSIVVTPTTNRQQRRSRTTTNTESEGSYQGQQKHYRLTNMWPFRYFGVNTDINDVLDVDDRIYPRARSRLGARYQADTLPVVESTTTTKEDNGSSSPILSFRAQALQRYKAKRLEKRSRKRPTRRNDMESSEPLEQDEDEEYFERGTDATVTKLFVPDNSMDEAILDQYMEKAKTLPTLPLPPYSSDYQDRALLELQNSNHDPDRALESLSKLTTEDFGYIVDWTKDEVKSFEEGVTLHGHDLYQVGRMVPSKRHADVVRFFFKWKKTDRYEPVYSQWTKVYKPAKRFKKCDVGKSISPGAGEPTHQQDDKSNYNNHDSESDAESGVEEPDPTVIRVSPEAMKDFGCANCGTTESRIWRRMPTDIDLKRKVFHQVLCNDCGEIWLKYSIMPKTTNEGGQRGRFRSPKAGGGMKRKRLLEDGTSKSRKVGDKDARNMVLAFTPSSCAVCKQMGPDNRLLTCYGCGISVHDDCYGANLSEKKGWHCDVCVNKKNPTASYKYQCILCNDSTTDTTQPLKQTAMYNWVHVLCALFVPETKFVHINTMQPVEYVGAIKPSRWEQTCHLCEKRGGVCVGCQTCKKPMHTECAIRNNYTVGFELIKPSAENMEAVVSAGRFNPESPAGVLAPRIWCLEHSDDVPNDTFINLTSRTCDEENESVIRLYANLCKQVESGTTPATRRYKAVVTACNKTADWRSTPELSTASSLSPTITATTEPSFSSPSDVARQPIPAFDAVHPACSQCPITYSPYWWKANVASDALLCHRCYWSHHPNSVS